MQYLTYEEYQETGGTLDETAFNRNITRVNGIIDNYTFRRIEKMESIPEQAKALCRDLVECVAHNVSIDEKTVTSRSQSAGAVSESESYAVKTQQEMKLEIAEMVLDYLYSVVDEDGDQILYKGCSH